MDECCDASGGRVSITANGRQITSRGGIRLMPTNVERTENANDDGSISIQSKAVVPNAEFTLIDKCDFDFAVLEQCNLNITFDFIDMKRKWLYTNARLVGRPTINSETGEIQGIKVVSRHVRGPLPY